jgi:hypothetical protein
MPDINVCYFTGEKNVISIGKGEPAPIAIE